MVYEIGHGWLRLPVSFGQNKQKVPHAMQLAMIPAHISTKLSLY